ncbi:hypothetical protein [Nitrospira sp. Nam74]
MAKIRFLSLQQPDKTELRRAEENVGATPIERAQWLLKFCQSGSESIEPDEARRRQAEWKAFANDPKPLDKNALQHVRTSLQRRLKALIEGKPVEMKVSANRILSLAKNGIGIKTSFEVYNEADRPLLLLVAALEAVGNRFRTCDACKTAYIHHGNWKFCTKLCRWQMSQQRYRKKKREAHWQRSS